MGILILLGIAWLGALGYWQYWASVAKRDERWNRWHYCIAQRNTVLFWSAVGAAVVAALYFS